MESKTSLLPSVVDSEASISIGQQIEKGVEKGVAEIVSKVVDDLSTANGEKTPQKATQEKAAATSTQLPSLPLQQESASTTNDSPPIIAANSGVTKSGGKKTPNKKAASSVKKTPSTVKKTPPSGKNTPSSSKKTPSSGKKKSLAFSRSSSNVDGLEAVHDDFSLAVNKAIGDRKAARHSKSQLEVTPSEGELAFFSDPVTLRFDVADDEVDKGTGIVWSTVVRAVEQKGSSTLYYGSYSDHVDRQKAYPAELVRRQLDPLPVEVVQSAQADEGDAAAAAVAAVAAMEQHKSQGTRSGKRSRHRRDFDPSLLGTVKVFSYVASVEEKVLGEDGVSLVTKTTAMIPVYSDRVYSELLMVPSVNGSTPMLADQLRWVPFDAIIAVCRLDQFEVQQEQERKKKEKEVKNRRQKEQQQKRRKETPSNAGTSQAVETDNSTSVARMRAWVPKATPLKPAPPKAPRRHLSEKIKHGGDGFQASIRRERTIGSMPPFDDARSSKIYHSIDCVIDEGLANRHPKTTGKKKNSYDGHDDFGDAEMLQLEEDYSSRAVPSAPKKLEATKVPSVQLEAKNVPKKKVAGAKKPEMANQPQETSTQVSATVNDDIDDDGRDFAEDDDHLLGFDDSLEDSSLTTTNVPDAKSKGGTTKNGGKGKSAVVKRRPAASKNPKAAAVSQETPTKVSPTTKLAGRTEATLSRFLTEVEKRIGTITTAQAELASSVKRYGDKTLTKLNTISDELGLTTNRKRKAAEQTGLPPKKFSPAVRNNDVENRPIPLAAPTPAGALFNITSVQQLVGNLGRSPESSDPTSAAEPPAEDVVCVGGEDSAQNDHLTSFSEDPNGELEALSQDCSRLRNERDVLAGQLDVLKVSKEVELAEVRQGYEDVLLALKRDHASAITSARQQFKEVQREHKEAVTALKGENADLVQHLREEHLPDGSRSFDLSDATGIVADYQNDVIYAVFGGPLPSLLVPLGGGRTLAALPEYVVMANGQLISVAAYDELYNNWTLSDDDGPFQHSFILKIFTLTQEMLEDHDSSLAKGYFDYNAEIEREKNAEVEREKRAKRGREASANRKRTPIASDWGYGEHFFNGGADAETESLPPMPNLVSQGGLSLTDEEQRQLDGEILLAMHSSDRQWTVDDFESFTTHWLRRRRSGGSLPPPGRNRRTSNSSSHSRSSSSASSPYGSVVSSSSSSSVLKASGANSRVTPDPPRHALRVGGSKISFNTLQTDPATGEKTKAKLNRREDASASLSSATKARTSFRSKDNSVPQAEIDTSLMEVDDFDTVEDMADVLLVAQKNSESRLANSDFGDLGDNGDDDALMEKDKNLLIAVPTLSTKKNEVGITVQIYSYHVSQTNRLGFVYYTQLVFGEADERASLNGPLLNPLAKRIVAKWPMPDSIPGYDAIKKSEKNKSMAEREVDKKAMRATQQRVEDMCQEMWKMVAGMGIGAILFPRNEVISVKNVVVSKSFDDMLRDAEFPPVIKQIMTLARFSLRLHSCKNVKPLHVNLIFLNWASRLRDSMRRAVRSADTKMRLSSYKPHHLVVGEKVAPEMPKFVLSLDV